MDRQPCWVRLTSAESFALKQLTMRARARAKGGVGGSPGVDYAALYGKLNMAWAGQEYEEVRHEHKNRVTCKTNDQVEVAIPGGGVVYVSHLHGIGTLVTVYDDPDTSPLGSVIVRPTKQGDEK